MQGNNDVLTSLALVIPVYNRAALVGETLESVASQSVRPTEVILVDNGSQDDSLRVIESWRDKMISSGWNVKVLIETRKGAAAARQKGLDATTSEYVMFFDSDDWMPADHVRNILKDLGDNPYIDLLCWNLRLHDADGKVATRRIDPFHPVRNHFIQGLLSTQAYVVRTSYIRDCGGWNREIGGWDDYELGVRLLLGDPKMRIDRAARVDVRVHGESITGDGYSHRMGDWERTLDAIEQSIRKAGRADMRRMLRYVAYRRIILAAHYLHEGHASEAESLKRLALASDALRPFDRLLLSAAYRFTSRGHRGAGAIIPPLL